MYIFLYSGSFGRTRTSWSKTPLLDDVSCVCNVHVCVSATGLMCDPRGVHLLGTCSIRTPCRSDGRLNPAKTALIPSRAAATAACCNRQAPAWPASETRPPLVAKGPSGGPIPSRWPLALHALHAWLIGSIQFGGPCKMHGLDCSARIHGWRQASPMVPRQDAGGRRVTRVTCTCTYAHNARTAGHKPATHTNSRQRTHTPPTCACCPAACMMVCTPCMAVAARAQMAHTHNIYHASTLLSAPHHCNP